MRIVAWFVSNESNVLEVCLIVVCFNKFCMAVIYKRNLCFKNKFQRVSKSCSALLFSLWRTFLFHSIQRPSHLTLIVYLGCVSNAFWVSLIEIVFYSLFSFTFCVCGFDCVCMRVLLLFLFRSFGSQRPTKSVDVHFEIIASAYITSMNWRRIKWDFRGE